MKFGDGVGSGVWKSLYDVLDPGWIAEDRAGGGHYCLPVFLSYCLTGGVDVGKVYNLLVQHTTIQYMIQQPARLRR